LVEVREERERQTTSAGRSEQALELALDLQVAALSVPRQHIVQEPAQLRRCPLLPIAKLVKQPIDRLPRTGRGSSSRPSSLGSTSNEVSSTA
jgi:hypothetical protein